MPHTVPTPADPAALLLPPPAAAKSRGNPNLGLAARCDPGTIHGHYGANGRADNRFHITLLRIGRVDIALDRYQAHLPPAFAARVRGYPPDLMPTPRPRGGITAAEDRDMRHAVAASLTPWRAAIAEARAAHRAARITARSTQRATRARAADGQTRAAHTNALSSPPAPPPAPIVSYPATASRTASLPPPPPDRAPPPTARRKGHRRPAQPRRSNHPVRTPSRPRLPHKTPIPRFPESTP
jgi:hypothetical protein